MIKSSLLPPVYDTATLLEEIQNEVASYTLKHPLRHVALIPDGNRRWAKTKERPFFDGYIQGSHTLMKAALTAKTLQIPIVTVFTFSTENWRRPRHEQKLLWELFTSHLQFYKSYLMEAGIRLATIGNIHTVPNKLQETLLEVKEATKGGTSLTLILAMNYGGRDEIIRAVNKILLSQRKTNQPLSIDETLFSQYLDTHLWPDPDLIIRTGGEQRLSNFLLWQSSYSELYVEKEYWPDFSPKHFTKALEDFQKRTRRHGGGDA